MEEGRFEWGGWILKENLGDGRVSGVRDCFFLQRN